MPRINTASLIARAARLLAADTTKALVAAPGAGFFLRIFRCEWTVRVAAAQIIDVGVDGGTDQQQLFSIASSASAPGEIEVSAGFDLPVNTAFSAKPAAAGPDVRFLVEYEIKQS